MHETSSITPQNNIEFKQAPHYSLPLIKQFYKKNGMRAQAPKGDIIYIASLNNSVIGALRLNPVDDYYLLRSMCIAEEKRAQGIGSQLLQHIQNSLSEIDCYCFPFSHLHSFYTAANFQQINPQSAPNVIHKKFARYIESGKDIILMKYQRKTSA